MRWYSWVGSERSEDGRLAKRDLGEDTHSELIAISSEMVQLGGLEPPTSGSTIRRSNQLSYNCTHGLAANSSEPLSGALPPGRAWLRARPQAYGSRTQLSYNCT